VTLSVRYGLFRKALRRDHAVGREVIASRTPKAFRPKARVGQPFSAAYPGYRCRNSLSARIGRIAPARNAETPPDATLRFARPLRPVRLGLIIPLAKRAPLEGPAGRHVYSLRCENIRFRAPTTIRSRSKRGSPIANRSAIPTGGPNLARPPSDPSHSLVNLWKLSKITSDKFIGCIINESVLMCPSGSLSSHNFRVLRAFRGSNLRFSFCGFALPCHDTQVNISPTN
jgi:hypothetical protein